MSRCVYKIRGVHSKQEIENVICNWVIGSHSERNNKALVLKLIEGHTYEQVAEELNISDITVKKIVREWYPIIQNVLDNTK